MVTESNPHRPVTIDPRAGALVLMLFIAAVLVLPGDLRLAALCLPPVITAALGGTVRLLYRRLRLVLPMLLALALLVAARSPGETLLFSLAGIDFHSEALLRGGVSGLRLLLIAAASILYTLMFSIDMITSALRNLRVPDHVISVLWLAQRLLDILHGEAGRMMDCIRARSAELSLPARLRTSARLSGTFLLRAVERSERLGDAMAVRGFSGSIPIHSPLHWRTADSIVLLGALLCFTLLFLF